MPLWKISEQVLNIYIHIYIYIYNWYGIGTTCLKLQLHLPGTDELKWKRQPYSPDSLILTHIMKLLQVHWYVNITSEDIRIDVFSTLRPRQNSRNFADDIFKCIFLGVIVWFSIKISLKFVLKGQINNNPALVQIMARRRPGDKPLSEPMMVSSLTHLCVTQPQWVK